MKRFTFVVLGSVFVVPVAGLAQPAPAPVPTFTIPTDPDVFVRMLPAGSCRTQAQVLIASGTIVPGGTLPSRPNPSICVDSGALGSFVSTCLPLLAASCQTPPTTTQTPPTTTTPPATTAHTHRPPQPPTCVAPAVRSPNGRGCVCPTVQYIRVRVYGRRDAIGCAITVAGATAITAPNLESLVRRVDQLEARANAICAHPVNRGDEVEQSTDCAEWRQMLDERLRSIPSDANLSPLETRLGTLESWRTSTVDPFISGVMTEAGDTPLVAGQNVGRATNCVLTGSNCPPGLPRPVAAGVASSVEALPGGTRFGTSLSVPMSFSNRPDGASAASYAFMLNAGWRSVHRSRAAMVGGWYLDVGVGAGHNGFTGAFAGRVSVGPALYLNRERTLVATAGFAIGASFDPAPRRMPANGFSDYQGLTLGGEAGLEYRPVSWFYVRGAIGGAYELAHVTDGQGNLLGRTGGAFTFVPSVGVDF